MCYGRYLWISKAKEKTEMFALIVVSIFMLVSLAVIVISCVMKNGLTRNCTVAVEAVIENNELHHSYSRNHIYHVPVYI